MTAKTATRWLFGMAGLAAASYAAYVTSTWFRYGKRRRAGEADSLLDGFLPDYEVIERHSVRVAAPAHVTFAAAAEMDLQSSALVRAIFRSREWLLGSQETERAGPRGIVEEMKSLGWGVLEDIPGHAVVLGAVTQPWLANVLFRALPPGEYAAFGEPDYVKIVVSFRADPAGEGESVFRTETRAAATDPTARAKFRRYWSLVSPGIILIRWVSLSLVKREAERQARAMRAVSAPAAIR